ncbi:MAG: hypothetical protein DRJ03_05295 [Chloroflexi bacterium]|nr:MAG: hypothetical protein DRJ03_05295 [Chloroflexota bacterium]
MLAFEELTGNLAAKRAIEVAAVGGLKVALVALDREAARVLAEAASSLDVPYTFELTLCPCGNWGSPRPCSCTPEEIKVHQRSLTWREALKQADLWVAVHPPDRNELRDFLNGRRGESLQDIARKVERARSGYTTSIARVLHCFTADAQKLLLKAAEEFQLTWGDVLAVVRCTEAIRALEAAPAIEASHVAEAAGYRPQNLKSLVVP